MRQETRICHWCLRPVPKEDWCPDCLAAFPNRPATHTMTPDEREVEFDNLRWTEVPFDLIHGRIEALAGRPVWTHELGLNFEGVKRECRWEGRPATMTEIIDLIPPEKLIVYPMEASTP